MKSLFCAGAAAGILLALSAPAAAATRYVCGTLLYADYAPVGVMLPGGGSVATRPIRNVTVSLEKNGTSLGTTTTYSTGYYCKLVDAAVVTAGSTLRIKFQSENYASHVYVNLDWSNAWLVWKNDVTVSGSTSTVLNNYTVIWSDYAVHFNILDSIQRGRQYADARRGDSDDITQVDVQYPDADWSNYNDFWEEITLAGPHTFGKAAIEAGDYGGNATDHGWDDKVILHEYGHHLEYDISDVGGPSNSHSACDDFGTEFGWKEGFPTYFAEVVRRTYPTTVVQTGGTLECTPGCATGGAEAMEYASLMDVYDGLAGAAAGECAPSAIPEPHDRMNGATYYGGTPLKDIVFKVFDKELEAAASSDIYGFAAGLSGRALYAGSQADMDRILAHHKECRYTFNDYTVSSFKSSGSSVSGQPVTMNMTLANAGHVYTDEPLTVQIWMYAPTKVVLDQFTIPGFTGSVAKSRSIVLPAGLAQATYPLYVTLDPLDRLPESCPEGSGSGEYNNEVVTSVSHLVCGNGVCSAGENCQSCPQDCGVCCGNGACDWWESCDTCGQDCGACGGCGDGFCTADEEATCIADCGEPGGSCFVAGTPITMADGSTKPIEQVQIGDAVLAFDEASGQLATGTVVHTFVHPDTERLVTVNGTLVTTVNHRFYTGGRWVAAERLSVGDDLLHAKSGAAEGEAALSIEPEAVRQVASLDGKATTYNFEVAQHHDYFAGGVLVHNLKAP